MRSLVVSETYGRGLCQGEEHLDAARLNEEAEAFENPLE